MKEKTFEIKPDGNSAEDLQIMTPKLFIAFGYFLGFAKMHDLPIKITNIKNKFAVSKSNTHPEGRAIDVSVINWPIVAIQDCKKYMDAKVGHLGAISSGTGERNVIYFHNAGLGDHFHIQVER